MKTFVILLIIVAFLHIELCAQKSAVDSVQVTILFKNKSVTVDSVYIIFDRYDLTGAGVIKSVFYPADNRIVIEKVPRGKYFVDIYSIGVDRQIVTRIRRIGKKRSNTLEVPFKTYETYIPGTAIIPPSNIDPDNLLVTQMKSRKP